MPVKIFFCYAREDEPLLNELKIHLEALRRQGLIEMWYDRNISAGAEWEKEIDKYLDTSQIILLLISQYFMASDYCYGIEMKKAMERHDRGEAVVIPVILRPVYFQEASFSKLQSLPTDAKPVKSKSWLDQDEAFFDIAEGIRRVVVQLKEFVLLRTLKGHSGGVRSVAISSDGQNIVSNSTDGTIKVWNLHTGRLLSTLTHSLKVFPDELAAAFSVAISPDGQTIVSGNDDNTIMVWNLHTGRLLHTLTGYGGRHEHVAISPDGQTIVSDNGTIKVWNLHTGQLLRKSKVYLGDVRIFAISPDGQTIVRGGAFRGSAIKVCNLHTGELLHTLIEHSDMVFSVAISPDGQTIVSGSRDNSIKVWNLHTGRLLHTLIGHSDMVLSVAISPDGQTIVSGGHDNTIKVWGKK